VLYGSGGFLSSYSIAEATEGRKAQVFSLNRIHGIKSKSCFWVFLILAVEQLPDDLVVLLWGSSSFSCFPLDEYLQPSSPNTIPQEIIAPDWILDARMINSETIGLVTAHNALHLFSLKTKVFTRRFNCEEQSLLYAAQIYLTSENNIAIASGTVFNEIQIWTAALKSSTTTVTSPTHVLISQRLKGHEGCIFSLRFNRDGTLLASCSDDRTIRVWDVKQGKFLAIGFAHLARVWDVRFVPFKHIEGEFLFSTSEDTSAILWQLSRDNGRLKVLERYNGHSGKHVWSQDVSSDGSIAVTGGNDGAINLWELRQWNIRRGQGDNEISWKEKALMVDDNGKEKVDMIRGCRCLDKDRLIITTQSGYLPCLGLLIQDVFMYTLCRRGNGRYCFRIVSSKTTAWRVLLTAWKDWSA
jgi:WD40 repeat protein